jgi:hypothetical protein
MSPKFRSSVEFLAHHKRIDEADCVLKIVPDAVRT